MRELIQALAVTADAWMDPEHPSRAEAVEMTLEANDAFTEEAVAFAVNQQMSLLTEDALTQWEERLRPMGDVVVRTAPRVVDPTVLDIQSASSSTVAVLNPGNIPMVEMQDLVAVLLGGREWFGVLSSRSPELIPAFLGELVERAPDVRVRIGDLGEALDIADTLIASGSDDVMEEVARRGREAGIPDHRQWIRRNRFSVAIIDGKESEEEREALAEDALLHEGMGCRNVALIFAPEGTSPDPYLEAFAAFRGTFPAPESTRSRLRMQRAFLKAIDVPHAFSDDFQFLLSRGEPEVQLPGHIRWCESVESIAWIRDHADRIQSVFRTERLAKTCPGGELPGSAGRPVLMWKPDGVEHANFLGRL